MRLTATGAQLDQASQSLDRLNTLRAQLEADMDKLEAAMTGGASQWRAPSTIESAAWSHSRR